MVRGWEEDTCRGRGGWETWWRVLEVEVRVVLVSTARPDGVHTGSPLRPWGSWSWRPEWGLSMLRPGNRLSSLSPDPDPNGGGRGLREELWALPGAGESRGREGGGMEM